MSEIEHDFQIDLGGKSAGIDFIKPIINQFAPLIEAVKLLPVRENIRLLLRLWANPKLIKDDLGFQEEFASAFYGAVTDHPEFLANFMAAALWHPKNRAAVGKPDISDFKDFLGDNIPIDKFLFKIAGLKLDKPEVADALLQRSGLGTEIKAALDDNALIQNPLNAESQSPGNPQAPNPGPSLTPETGDGEMAKVV